MPHIGSPVPVRRYEGTEMELGQEGSVAIGAAGRAYFTPVDIPWRLMVDRIAVVLGTPIAGNVRVAIYRAGATPEAALGGALVVESASLALAGTNQTQLIPIAETLLLPGHYFVAVQTTNPADVLFRWRDDASNFGQYYDVAGGYGAFTDPCPAMTVATSVPLVFLRVSRNLAAGDLCT